MTITAIVPAAGCGARAALNGNKILAPICGKPLLFWTLRALQNAGMTEIIVAARREEFELIQKAAGEIRVQIVEGGATRQDSVFAGVQKARGDFVLVHDAARPLVSPELVKKVVDAAKKSGGAIAALPATDTVKLAGKNSTQIEKTLPREQIWLAQTPQVFARDLFLEALQNAQNQGFVGTDCASIFENQGFPVSLVEGEAENFKVTFAADLARAQAILEQRLGGKF